MILKTSHSLYAHIDCNCFFVSCERIRDCSIQNMPVVVAGDIVLASSYECKKFGVYTGMPLWTAKKLVGPSLRIYPPDLKFYKSISQKFFEFLRQIFQSIEPFSIDETFAYIGEKSFFKDMNELELFVQELQNNILSAVGIPVSIGVANTRIKAKIFSDLRKPLGYYLSDPESDEELFNSLPVNTVPFIAKGTQEKLGIGIKTIADFTGLSFFHIQRLLGKHGIIIWLELQGVDVWRGSDTGKSQKTLIRSRSFSRELSDNREVIWRRVCENFNVAYQDLTLRNLSLQEIGIFFRTKEFVKIQGNHSFYEAVNDRKILLEALQELFFSTWKVGYIYRTTGIFFGKIGPIFPKQLSLFEQVNKTSDSDITLERTLVDIKKRYGEKIIHFGSGKGFFLDV